MKTIRLLILAIGILFTGSIFAQRGHGGHGRKHHPHRGKVVVVHRSPYRPHKVIVYHPHWRPAYTCNRRWVYFPRHNFYWDNWRNHYVFWNGVAWVSQSNAPATIVNINLSNEPTKELKEDDDDVDDIYKSNDQHKTEYKSE
ncbi:MAG: hypothetical protein IT236_05405 [Bacteroidia bacterium]|nr:hypothetical protein [Bacteroidia bacterium]